MHTEGHLNSVTYGLKAVGMSAVCDEIPTHARSIASLRLYRFFEKEMHVCSRLSLHDVGGASQLMFLIRARLQDLTMLDGAAWIS